MAYSALPQQRAIRAFADLIRVGAFAASDCDPLQLVACVVAGLAFLGLGGWLLLKPDESSYERRRARKRGAVAAAVGLVLVSLGGGMYVAEARERGRDQIASEAGSFASVNRYLAAQKLGYRNDGDYAAHLEQQEAAMARASEANKIDAVEAFRRQVVASRTDERERIAEGKAAERSNEEARAKSCRNDPECFARENMAGAVDICARRVADLSDSYSDWVNKAQEPRFGRFNVKNLERGVVTYIGDKIRFPDGTGGMVNQIYECDFDVGNNRVVGVRARAGSLPR